MSHFLLPFWVLATQIIISDDLDINTSNQCMMSDQFREELTFSDKEFLQNDRMNETHTKRRNVTQMRA